MAEQANKIVNADFKTTDGLLMLKALRDWCVRPADEFMRELACGYSV